MVSESNPNPVVGEILLSATEKYLECIFKNAQHNLSQTYKVPAKKFRWLDLNEHQQ